MTGAAERKERESKLVLDEVGTRKCWSDTSEENEPVDDNEYVKQDIEESLYGGLYKLWQQAV